MLKFCIVDVDNWSMRMDYKQYEKMLELCMKHENEIKRTDKNYQISMVIL